MMTIIILGEMTARPDIIWYRSWAGGSTGEATNISQLGMSWEMMRSSSARVGRVVVCQSVIYDHLFLVIATEQIRKLDIINST